MLRGFVARNGPVYSLRVGLTLLRRVELEATGMEFHPDRSAVDSLCLCMTTEGNGQVISDGQTYFAAGNSILLLSTQGVPAARCADQRWQFWWAQFEAPELALEPNRVYTTSMTGRLSLFLDQGLFLAAKGETEAAAAVLSAALATLQNDCKRPQSNSGVAALAEEYVHNNLATATVSALCRHLSVTDRTLRNIFYRQFGMSPKRYILRERMEVASRMLEDSAYSVSGVADRLGFANPFHFSGSFKAFYGCSPSEYRKSL